MGAGVGAGCFLRDFGGMNPVSGRITNISWHDAREVLIFQLFNHFSHHLVPQLDKKSLMLIWLRILNLESYSLGKNSKILS